MPFCTNCGAEITRADASHCTSCGAEVRTEEATGSRSAGQQESSESQETHTNTTPQQPLKSTRQSPEHHQQDTHPRQTPQDADPSRKDPHNPQQPGEIPSVDQQPHDDSAGQMSSVDGSVGASSTTWRNVALGLSAIATLSILAFFGFIMMPSPSTPGTSAIPIGTMRYLLWAYPLLSLLAGIAIVADWWALKQANVSWLPAFGYALGIGLFALTPIAAPIYYFHRP